MRAFLPLVWCAVLILVVAPTCSERGEPKRAPSPTPRVVVSGVVRGTPPRGMPPLPPSSSPALGAPVRGARVSLRRFVDRDAAAGSVLASTVTDSAGAYRLEAPPGTYFLVVSHAVIPHAVFTLGYEEKNFAPSDSVNASRVVELTEDATEDFVLPQAWPQ